MALYTVSSGGQINAADINQLVNLLNGTTTGVAVTLASTLSIGGTPGFIVDWGTFTHDFGGSPDNFTITMNRNFNSRSDVAVMVFLLGVNNTTSNPSKTLATSVTTTTNPATFVCQMNDGNIGTTYAFGWFAIG